MQLAILREELLSITSTWQEAVILNHFLFLLKRTKSFDNYVAELEAVLGDDVLPGSEKIGLKHGWFYKSARDLSRELMFGWSPSTALKYVEKLVESTLIERRHNPHFGWDKTYQYRPDVPLIQQKLLENGYVLDGFPITPPTAQPKPMKKPARREHTSEELLGMLLGGRANTSGGDEYDAAERVIKDSGWVIRPDAARKAAIHFFAALPSWIDDMPTSKTLRAKWAKGFREHASEFPLDALYGLYQQAWAELRDSGLSITWPGAMTNKMVEIRRKNRNQKADSLFGESDDDPQVAALTGGDDDGK